LSEWHNDSSEEMLNKIVDVTESTEKWFQNKEFDEILSKVGTIGHVIGLGLTIYKIYKKKKDKDLKPKEKAFASLIKVVLESAKVVLYDNDYEFKDNVIEIKKELLADLFAAFTNDDFSGDYYLLNHKVVSNFRERLCDLLRKSNLPSDKISIILYDFNSTLEKKATDKAEDIAEFYKWWDTRKNYKNLIDYLDYVRTVLKYEINGVDKKPWYGYYVKSKAFVLPMNTWKKDYEKIPTNSALKWSPDEFLKEERKGNWFTIIGAPFGIGKTSLSKYIAIKCAEKYLDKPEDSSNYIPIFVRLRYGLNNAYRNLDLKTTLEHIAPEGESKKRKILVICDGLDEYVGDIFTLKKELSEYVQNNLYPNIKVIITTRLKAGWTGLFDTEEYVRLFPFDTSQIDEFFFRYTGKGENITYLKIKQKYALRIQELGRPLFCWMLAITQSPDLSEYNISIDGNIGSENAKRALIFHQFIHSIVMGKHKSETQTYYKLLEHYKYDEDIEKKVLRKIAALKQIYPNHLTKSLVSELIKRFGFSSEIIEQMLEPILTSYFYIQNESENVSRDELLDFMHESLREYLVAEYYIESLYNDNKQHRLCIGIPSEETIKFLDGLIELLVSDNSSIKKPLSRFTKSLTEVNYDIDGSNSSFMDSGYFVA
jgi:hypothetical protein